MQIQTDPKLVKELFSIASPLDTTFVGLLDKEMKLLESHDRFPNLESQNALLCEINVIKNFTTVFTHQVSIGFIFTATDFITNLSMYSFDKKQRNGVSVAIEVKYFTNERPQAGGKMYVLAVTENFFGNFGFASGYFYDEHFKLFAKGSQITYYFNSFWTSAIKNIEKKIK